MLRPGPFLGRDALINTGRLIKHQRFERLRSATLVSWEGSLLRRFDPSPLRVPPEHEFLHSTVIILLFSDRLHLAMRDKPLNQPRLSNYNEFANIKKWEVVMTVTMRNALSTFGRQPCLQCGGNIVAPAWSEYAQASRVRVLWHCDACNYDFETTIVFRDDFDKGSDVAA